MSTSNFDLSPFLKLLYLNYIESSNEYFYIDYLGPDYLIINSSDSLKSFPSLPFNNGDVSSSILVDQNIFKSNSFDSTDSIIDRSFSNRNNNEYYQYDAPGNVDVLPSFHSLSFSISNATQPINSASSISLLTFDSFTSNSLPISDFSTSTFYPQYSRQINYSYIADSIFYDSNSTNSSIKPLKLLYDLNSWTISKIPYGSVTLSHERDTVIHSISYYNILSHGFVPSSTLGSISSSTQDIAIYLFTLLLDKSEISLSHIKLIINELSYLISSQDIIGIPDSFNRYPFKASSKVSVADNCFLGFILCLIVKEFKIDCTIILNSIKSFVLSYVNYADGLASIGKVEFGYQDNQVDYDATSIFILFSRQYLSLYYDSNLHYLACVASLSLESDINAAYFNPIYEDNNYQPYDVSYLLLYNLVTPLISDYSFLLDFYFTHHNLAIDNIISLKVDLTGLNSKPKQLLFFILTVLHKFDVLPDKYSVYYTQLFDSPDGALATSNNNYFKFISSDTALPAELATTSIKHIQSLSFDLTIFTNGNFKLLEEEAEAYRTYIESRLVSLIPTGSSWFSLEAVNNKHSVIRALLYAQSYLFINVFLELYNLKSVTNYKTAQGSGLTELANQLSIERLDYEDDFTLSLYIYTLINTHELTSSNINTIFKLLFPAATISYNLDLSFLPTTIYFPSIVDGVTYYLPFTWSTMEDLLPKISASNSSFEYGYYVHDSLDDTYTFIPWSSVVATFNISYFSNEYYPRLFHLLRNRLPVGIKYNITSYHTFSVFSSNTHLFSSHF